ncbi:E3 ubiquitin-protein ligase TRIM50-like [Anguilla rostrata]|uniref:E3 ubiquitin-protein ligase TRIM50-like n=1 Tax=Anguilla rostrata TaxID=7938 RepID=UPI0030D2F663
MVSWRSLQVSGPPGDSGHFSRRLALRGVLGCARKDQLALLEDQRVTRLCRIVSPSPLMLQCALYHHPNHTHQITPIISVYSRMKEDISCLMTELQTQRRKLEEQICKMSHNKSRITNESDVLKWVIRKEFGELRRLLEEEEAGFMQTVESSASALVASIQTQADDMALVLAKFQEAEGTLEGLSNESHLDFIRKYGSIAPRFRECQQKQQREERSYSAITFKPGFNHSDIKLSVWKRLHRRVLPAPEQLKLDPLTAHPLLRLSRGDTAVECGVLPHRLHNNPERFSYSYCVLASRGFSAGKHLWEVGVAGKRKWRLGVVKGTVSRKAKLPKSPEAGVWLIGLKEGGLYEAFASPRVTLPLSAPPATIAVFLDYERGELSFFAADSPQELGLLYRFRCDFQGKLYPLFDVCWHERGANKQPITLPPPPCPQISPLPPPPAPK